MTYKPDVFVIDGLEGEFPGFTAGDRWNGWACPFFTRDVADRIAVAFVNQFAEEDRAGVTATYTPVTDTYRLRCEENGPEDTQGQDICVNGGVVHVYAIGAFCWCWNTTSDFEDPRWNAS